MNRTRNITPNNPGRNTNGMNGMGGMNNMGRVGGVTGNGDMNGRTDMNGRVGMNGRDANGGALTGTLAEQIRTLGFVKAELELYLDTHPRCRTALDYYYKTVEELKRLVEEYQNTVGPLTAMGNLSTEQWNWVDGPWPWQQAGDFMREGER